MESITPVWALGCAARSVARRHFLTFATRVQWGRKQARLAANGRVAQNRRLTGVVTEWKYVQKSKHMCDATKIKVQVLASLFFFCLLTTKGVYLVTGGEWPKEKKACLKRQHMLVLDLVGKRLFPQQEAKRTTDEPAVALGGTGRAGHESPAGTGLWCRANWGLGHRDVTPRTWPAWPQGLAQPPPAARQQVPGRMRTLGRSTGLCTAMNRFRNMGDTVFMSGRLDLGGWQQSFWQAFVLMFGLLQL